MSSQPSDAGHSLQALLRSRYEAALAASLELPAGERIIVYDPSECEAIEHIGPFVKRLEPRRQQKQKKGTPDDCDVVRPSMETIVCPVIDPERFNFTKIRHDERLHSMDLVGERYHFVVNKYPALPYHLLMVSEELRPQVLTKKDLEAVGAFLNPQSKVCSPQSYLAFYNSWSAAATVNHMHFQLFEGPAPIQGFGLDVAETGVQFVANYPADNIVFDAEDVDAVWRAVRRLIALNWPHNILFSPTHTYLFPRNQDPAKNGKEIYGEEPGGIEYAGIFIAYNRQTFDALTLPKIHELLAVTTARAPLNEPEP